MNRYSLSAESPRWWWRSATAGGAALAAVSLLFLLPGAGSQAVPVHQAPDDPGTTQPEGAYVERPCYMARPGWNDWDWEQPVCRTYLGKP